MAVEDRSRPWHRLPAKVAAVLRPELPGVAEETIAALREGVSAYARPLEGAFGRGLRVGVEEALGQFVAEIEAGERVPRAEEVYIGLGRGEMRAGRTLEALLAAYRLGARVAWRRFAAAGDAAGLAPDVLYLLAESIFAYIDELSAESAEGYALEQSATAGETQVRRRRLARLLVREPPVDPAAVEDAAVAAGWKLPERLAVLALEEQDRAPVAGRLPVEAIVESVGDVLCAVIPDPAAPGRVTALGRAIAAGAARGALGPEVGWPEAALSFARARAALELAREGLASASDGLVLASDHTSALLLRADRRLAAELAASRLAPLDELPDATRDKLTATLAAWLDEQGRLQAVAERLAVHPQTVRYRVAQLRELLGQALDEPDGRFELALALRARASGAGPGRTG